MSGSLRSLRELNRLRVLEAVRERGTVSRADIARHTGLSRSTVSSLVGELQRDGARRRARRPARSAPGRAPAGAAHARPAAPARSSGSHFDHGTLRVAVADLAHTILAEATRDLDVDHDAEEGLEAAGAARRRGARRARASPRDRVLGAGVGIAGPVDAARGTRRRLDDPARLGGVDVAAELERRLGLPVHVDNDANLGALAESRLGAGRGASDARLPDALLGHRRRARSSAAGCTAAPAARPARSATCSSTSTGPICRCGNRGCLETFAGAGALARAAAPLATATTLSIEDMVALAADGDLGCQRVLADAGPHRRRRRRRAVQPAQPRARRRRRRPGPGRRAAARPAARGRPPLRDPRGGGDGARRAVGARASVPSCSARWSLSSASPTAPSPGAPREAVGR